MSVEQPPSICVEPGCGDLAVDYDDAPSSCDGCGRPFCGEHLRGDVRGWLCDECRRGARP